MICILDPLPLRDPTIRLVDTIDSHTQLKESSQTYLRGIIQTVISNFRELSYHTRVERLKHELQQRYDWTNRAAFETIDTTRDHALNSRNIQSFLRLNGFYATESELVAIIRRLDVDAD